MGINKEFDELKAKRLKLKEAMDDNDFGFIEILHKFYPEEARFIYELLQNAEDMNATKVKFYLFGDKLIFEHNGSKRDFTIEDVDAITNVNKSTKIFEETSIGKFGVGFKAVYAYTDTPEIHSGIYNFRIKYIIVPDDDGVVQHSEQGITKFILPFDSLRKPAYKAVEEILSGFSKLNETSILFLRNIKCIECYHNNILLRKISVEDINDNYFMKKITVSCNPSITDANTYWAKFMDDCPVMVEGEKHNYPVSIAFKMKYEAKWEIDEKLDGKVCIYFPTNERSNLKYHINAPFEPTISRTEIVDCAGNMQLIDGIAKLSIKAIGILKDNNLLDYSAYGAMPQNLDFTTSDCKYKTIKDQILNAFEENEWFISNDGKYYNMSSVIKSNQGVQKVIPDAFCFKIYGKRYMPVIKIATRTFDFIKQFSIEELTFAKMLFDIVYKEYKEEYNKLFDYYRKNNDLNYFKELYARLGEAPSNPTHNGYTFNKYEKLRNVKFIYCEDGKLHCSLEKIFIRGNYVPENTSPLFINLKLDISSTSEEQYIKSLLQGLGINVFTDADDIETNVIPTPKKTKELMEKLLNNKNDQTSLNRYRNKNMFLTFSGYRSASSCCWDEIVSFFYDGFDTLNIEEYKKMFPEQLEDIKKIFSDLGGKTGLEVKRHDKKDVFKEFIQSDLSEAFKKNKSNYGEFYVNWTFTGFYKVPFIKNETNKDKISKLLFNFVNTLYTYSYLNDKDDARYAHYIKNGKPKVYWKGDSLLIKILKNTEWIPTKNGELKRPSDINEKELTEDLKIDNRNKAFWDALSFGNPTNELIQKLKNADIDDENLLFFASMSTEKMKKLRKLAEDMTEEETKVAEELIDVISKMGREQKQPDEYEEQINRIKNIAKRKMHLENEFVNEKERKTINEGKVQMVLNLPNKKEKLFLSSEYHSKCQICDVQGILTASGKYYFEAINIFDTSNMDDSIKQTFDLGWNSICLCPLCAVKYKYGQLDAKDIIEQIQNQEVIENSRECYDIDIVLCNKQEKISFSPKHFLALQVAIRKLTQ